MLLVALLALGPKVLGDLRLNDGLGDIEGDLAAQVLEESITGSDCLLAGLALGDLLDEVLTQLLNGVELGASWANSSSTLGSSRCLTAVAVTVTSACSPACSRRPAQW